MCQGVQYSSQSPHSVDQSHVDQGHAGQQGQNTTIRPHPSWVVPTTAPESNVHIQPDQQAKSATALPGHQSSSEPDHQSKRLGHPRVQGIQDAHMRQVLNGTRVHKHQAFRVRINRRCSFRFRRLSRLPCSHLPRRTVHTAEPQSARHRSASHCRARLQRCCSPSTAPTVHTTEWQSAGISTETCCKVISHVAPLHTYITYGHTSRTGDGRPLQGQ